jgi:hypothetical protein
MKKIKKKRTRQYDPKKTERILLHAHNTAVLREAAKPLHTELAEKYCNLLLVHAYQMVRGAGTSVCLDILCFFGILSKNLAQLANVKSSVGDNTLEAIQHAAETAYFKKITVMDLSTGQKKALLELEKFCSQQIKSAATYHFADAYKHAQKCVVDMNRKSGIVASFGEMPELGQPFLSYEEFKTVIAQAKESIESQSNLRYKINLFSLEHDEAASDLAQQEADKMALDQRLFVTGQTLAGEEKSAEQIKAERKAARVSRCTAASLACTSNAIERISKVLEQLPLFFTSRTADEFVESIYASGSAFTQSASRQNMLTPTGKKVNQAVEYANPMHDAYDAWKESQEKPKRKARTESRA